MNPRHFIRNLRLRTKLTLLLLVPCVVVLLLAGVVVLWFQLIAFRQNFERDLASAADMIANNVTAAVTFNDEKSAAEMLRALRAKEHIVAAALVTADGRIFARYGRAVESRVLTNAPSHGQVVFGPREASIAMPVVLERKQIATLHVISDYRSVFSSLLNIVLCMISVVAAVAVGVAAVLSSRLQRLVSDPILRLADTARRVAEAKDYSVRASVDVGAEIGQLTATFNQMLEQIQKQDAALQQASRDLAGQVEELRREVAERERAEEALDHERNLLRTLIDNLPDYVYVKDTGGRFILGNRALAQSVGRTSPEEIVGKTDADLQPPELAARFRADEEAVVQSGQPLVNREEFTVDPGGKRHWMLSTKVPLRDPRGQIMGLVGVGRDITERKHAEERLQTLHKELVITSRQAGMAEVATGVLHNVGNVLNSVNVSSDLINQRLRRLPSDGVERLVAMFEAHQQDLGAFLSQDPKGRLVPQYLSTLAAHLAEEKTDIAREMDQLNRNIEHIKEIVAMQQNYARMAGVIEDLPVAGLVEDAICLNAGAFLRHGVEVRRDFAPVPPVRVDKHKVLQVLVNLLRNAKYALDDSSRADKQITVCIVQGSPDRVAVIVRDNGVGIAPENLTRIFQHGFTTRSTGHGFGLHSGALAASEMGGRLTAASDGPGRGAAFTLELPAAVNGVPHHEHAQ
jgi:PAS domain S-box-containing protein